MPNEQNYLPMIGVDMAYYAKMLTDPINGKATYQASERLPGLVQVAFAANSQTGSYFADNGPYAAAAQLGEMTLQVQCADLPPAIRAEWFGQSYVGGLLEEGQINPIEMAFMYRITKSNNAYRYVAFYKVKPAAPDETVNTQTNSISFQDGSVSMASTMRISDGKYRRILDLDDPQLPTGLTREIIEAKFFADPTWDLSTTP